jgi:hypothetical protein
MAASDQYKGRPGTVALGTCTREAQTHLCTQYILILYDLVSCRRPIAHFRGPREKGACQSPAITSPIQGCDYLLASICRSRMTAEARLSVYAFPGEDPALTCDLVGCED